MSQNSTCRPGSGGGTPLNCTLLPRFFARLAVQPTSPERLLLHEALELSLRLVRDELARIDRILEIGGLPRHWVEDLQANLCQISNALWDRK